MFCLPKSGWFVGAVGVRFTRSLSWLFACRIATNRFFSVVFVVFFEVPDWGIRTHDSIVFCFVGIHTATVHIYVLFVVVVVVSLFA